jgi:hypothetical protein
LGQEGTTFSIFGYLQDEHYGKIYHAFLTPNAQLTSMKLLTFVPGCHNNCPKFSSVYDSYGGYAYLIVSVGETSDIVGVYAVNKIKTMPIKFPPNVTALSFYGNGTAYLLKDNSNINSNSYAIYTWNTYTNTTVLKQSLSNIPYRFYRSCFLGSTLYALDRNSASLIIWQGSSLKSIKLSKNNLWVNSIETLNWGYQDIYLYALDRNGTVWYINYLLGICTSLNFPVWPAVHSTNSPNQIVIDKRAIKYFVGYDKTANVYRLANVDGGYSTLTDLQNGVNGLQWIGLTETYSGDDE